MDFLTKPVFEGMPLEMMPWQVLYVIVLFLILVATLNHLLYKPVLAVIEEISAVPSKLGEDLGARVIRGSSNSSGAKVLRDMKRSHNEGYSIFTAADGPTGPNRHFKEGVPLMARVLNVPMVPLAFAADRAWHLRRWDNFMIPKPFAKIVIAFGEPVIIPRGTPVRDLEPWRVKMENAVNSLTERSNLVFANKSE